ncbi:MAG: hypothetical protein LW832_06855 [Parachlamydia sp.]|jgi:hypothetical protein|nr:hypothetical protein [Parachlamydia sp.]
MRLSELLPQPARDIYNNYQSLSDPDIDNASRQAKIHENSQIFSKILLAIPVYTIIWSTFEAAVVKMQERTGAELIVGGGLFLLAPSTSCIVLGTQALKTSAVLLIQAISERCLRDLSVSILALFIGIAFLEGYTKFDGYPENFVIKPISERFAKVFI